MKSLMIFFLVIHIANLQYTQITHNLNARTVHPLLILHPGTFIVTININNVLLKSIRIYRNADSRYIVVLVKITIQKWFHKIHRGSLTNKN